MQAIDVFGIMHHGHPMHNYLPLHILLVVLFSTLAFAHSPSQPPSISPPESASILDDSLMRQLGKELATVTTKEVKQRKATRREFQRRGYQNVLLELLRQDSLGALLSFLKMNLHLEIFLPHNTIYVYQYVDSLCLPNPVVFRYDDGTELIFETKKVKLAIKEDWTLPTDLWREEE